MQNLEQYLPELTLPTIIGVSALALVFILYLTSKLVYVERGIVPIGIDYIGSIFDAIAAEFKHLGGFLFGYTKEELDSFLANEKLLRGLTNTITGISIILVLFSFLASYSATRDFVISRGISANVAFAIALGIDGFIVLLILFITYSALRGTRTALGTALLLGFTALSVYFNVSHLEPNSSVWTLAQGLAGAIAPLIVFIGAEVVATVQKAQVVRSGLVMTDADLRDRIVSTKAEFAQIQMKVDSHKGIIAGIDQEVKAFNDRRSEIKADIQYLEGVLEKLDQQFIQGVPNGNRRLDQVKTLMDQGLDQQEIADTLNVKPDTARAYIRNVNNGKA